MELNEAMVKGWLDRVNGWKSVGIKGSCVVEMIDAAADLVNFLSHLEHILTKLEPREILSQFPSVPKLLQSLLDNVLVQTTEDLHRRVLLCVAAVSVSSQQNKDGLSDRSVKWVQSQIKTVCSSYPALISSSFKLAEQLGFQPIDITEQFNEELVNSLVDDLQKSVPSREWSDLHRQFIPRYPMKGTTLRNISEMSLPIITKPIAQPLIAVILCCDFASDVIISNSNSRPAEMIIEQAVSPRFLNALRDNPKQAYLTLSPGIVVRSYESRVNLWRRDHVFFEEETVCLLEICCFERKFMSRKEMKKMVALRQLPKALGENISLFSTAFEIIQCVICETSGDFYVMKFVGVLVQLLCDFHLQKNKTLLADTWTINFANLWSAELANVVHSLTADWADMPTNSFFHHAKRVRNCIGEVCTAGKRGESYYIWLILQGFVDLMQRCYWAVLFASEQFVETCLTILFWYHGGGTELAENKKEKVRHIVDTLRHLRNKSRVTTNDVMCALDSKHTNILQPNVANLIRHFVTLFTLISCSADSLDFHRLFLMITEDLPVPDTVDQVLDIVEETLCLLNSSQWLSMNTKANIFSENCSKLCETIRTRCDEFVDEYSQNRVEGENQQQHNMFDDLRSRFDTLRKFLGTDTG